MAAESSARPSLRVGDQRQRPVLAGVEGLHVQPDDGLAGILEQRPGAGGEILQPGADGKDHVRLFGEPVCRRRAGHADRRHVERVIVGQRGFSALRLADRNARGLREFRQFAGRLRIEHAAAGDDQRLLRRLQRLGGRGEFGAVRPRTPLRPDAFGKEAFGIVIGFAPARPGRATASPGRIRPDRSAPAWCAQAPE